MSVLTSDNSETLKRFYERLLDLHAAGVVSDESALEYLMRTVTTVDLQDRAEIEELRMVLEDAWREP